MSDCDDGQEEPEAELEDPAEGDHDADDENPFLPTEEILDEQEKKVQNQPMIYPRNPCSVRFERAIQSWLAT